MPETETDITVGVLLVDDRPENLTALKGMLAVPDYHVVTATSGVEALALTLRQEFALILLDVVMPGMSGFEVADHLKEIERTRRIPIIFLTGVATDTDKIYRAYSVGAVDYLVKPISVDAVRSKVAVFANLYRQRREIEIQQERRLQTERREFALRAVELRIAIYRRYRNLVEGIDRCFGWSSDEGARSLSFVSRQAQAILGYAPERLASPGAFCEVIHPDDRERVMAILQQAASRGLDEPFTHRLVAADGRVLWFQTGVITDRAEDGEAELHGLSVDVTGIKEAEERQAALAAENARLHQEALKATRARDLVLAMVSHDLRTPLSSITLSATRLKTLGETQDVAAAQTMKMAAMIHRAAEQMSHLIEELLDVERIEMGQLRLQRAPEPAASLVTHAAELIEPLAREKSLELKTEADDVEGLAVPCDGGLIIRVLANLLGNAVKFSPAGARITLRARPQLDQVEFSVSDEGPGILPESIPHLFDPFWQAEDSKGGVGLGLAIAKGIVDAHGGRIRVESAPGMGTTFLFTLPVGAAAASTSGA